MVIWSLILLNIRICNFISVPQITRFLLGDAIISSKTDRHNGGKREKINYDKVKNNKTLLKILSFIQNLHLKQESSILWCFFRLKLEKSLFNNTFFSSIFCSKMIVHTAEKDQIKYFAQNQLGKITFFYAQTAAWLSCCCHKLLFHHFGNFRVLKGITIWTTTTSDRIHHLNIRKQKPYKTAHHIKLTPIGILSNSYKSPTWTKPSSENNKYIKFSVILNVSQREN